MKNFHYLFYLSILDMGNEYCLDFGADPVSKTTYITLECMNAVLERV